MRFSSFRVEFFRYGQTLLQKVRESDKEQEREEAKRVLKSYLQLTGISRRSLKLSLAPGAKNNLNYIEGL